MAYRHGVYTSEVATSVQAAPAVDSALPFVIGTAPKAIGPVLVTSWSSYCEQFGVSPQVDIMAGEYANGGTLTNFAYYWFMLAGRGDCIMQSTPSDSFVSGEVSVEVSASPVAARFAVDLSGVAADKVDAVRAVISGAVVHVSVDDSVYSAELVDASGAVYEGTLSDTSVCAPFTVSIGGVSVTITLIDAADVSAVTGAVFGAGVSEVESALHAYGSTASLAVLTSCIQSIHTIYERFGRVASILAAPRLCEIEGAAPAMASAVFNIGGRFKGVAVIDIPAGIGSSSVALADVGTSKPTTSPYAVLGWPYVGVGAMRFPASVAIVAAMNAVDGQYGGFPYVSPSNKALPVTGSYFTDRSAAVPAEIPVYLTRDDVNAYLGAYGVSGFRNTAAGWVVWGDNTAAFPGSTDVKDYMIPVRRMFNFVSNQFQVFCDSRIDLPLNRRQLDGVVNSFNQYLSGLIGFGALNAASIQLDDDRNTTQSLLSGTVYFRILIAPPPAMVVIEGALEYDVAGFEASLA